MTEGRVSGPRGGGARSLRPRGRPGDKSSPQRWAPPGTPWTSLSGVCPESYWGPVQGGLGCLEKAPWPQRLFSLSWMILPEHFCATGHLRMGGGAERRWGTPRAAPLSPAHPGPRPEVAMTATDASLARTDRPGKQRILRGTGRVSGCPQSLLWELLCLQLHPHLKL